MKRFVVAACTAAVALIVAGLAWAAPNFRGSAIEFITSVSAPFLAGTHPGIWLKSSDSNLYFHTSSGSDVQLTTSSGPVLLNPGSQQSGSINVSGSTTSASGFVGPSLDNAGTLQVGPTNATSVALAGANEPTTVGGILTVSGNQRYARRTSLSTTTNVSATTDFIVGINVSPAATVNLPSAVAGMVYLIHDESGAAATNNITITPAAGNIDGAGTKVINTNYGWYALYSDGSNWHVFSQGIGGSGTVTSISQGTGITASPNPLSTSGTIAVDQTFSPTWTGAHTFANASGTELTINNQSQTNTLAFVINNIGNGASGPQFNWNVSGSLGTWQLDLFTLDGSNTSIREITSNRHRVYYSNNHAYDSSPWAFGFVHAGDTNGTDTMIVEAQASQTGNILDLANSSNTTLTAWGAGGLLSKYNSQSTAGTGQAVILAAAQDVASLGGATTIVTASSPTSGLYRVSIAISAHTNTDTVSAQITYTDAVESFATTLTPISSVALTHDSNTGTTSSTTIIRASAATSIVASLSASTQTTTKASAIVERLN